MSSPSASLRPTPPCATNERGLAPQREQRPEPDLPSADAETCMLVCGRLRKCKPFLSLLLRRSVCSSGAPRHRSGSPSAAIVPLERRASLPAGPQGLPARSAAAVTRKGRNGVEEPRSGLTAAGDRARGRRFRARAMPPPSYQPPAETQSTRASTPILSRPLDLIDRTGLPAPPCAGPYRQYTGDGATPDPNDLSESTASGHPPGQTPRRRMTTRR